jgi:cation transporter-like permease
MSASGPSKHSLRREQEARSLDLVQRVIVSGLVAIVFGTFAAVLAAYLAIRGENDLPHFSVVGLWIMTGVMGLATAAAILLINRRRPYSPWVLLGLLPMVISAPWILR